MLWTVCFINEKFWGSTAVVLRSLQQQRKQIRTSPRTVNGESEKPPKSIFDVC